MSSQIRFRWLGVAAVEIGFQGSTLLVDPFLTRPSWTRLIFGKVATDKKAVGRYIEKCDYILITHSHFDHIMDVPNVIRKTGAVAFGSVNSCQLLTVEKIPKDKYYIIESGDKLNLGKFKVEVLLGDHPTIPGFTPGELSTNLRPPLSLRDYKMDSFFSFLIEVNKLNFLIWNNSDLEKVPKADIIFLVPENDNHYYKKLLLKVQPKIIVPIHWDDFFLPLSKKTIPSLRWPKKLSWSHLLRQNLDQFTSDVKKIYPRGKVLIPEIFSTYEF